MKNYLVVGGSSGIGEAVVQLLRDANHHVIATYFNRPKENAERASYRFFNVLDKSTPLDFIPPVLDGLVFCPGSISLKPFSRLSQEDLFLDFDLQVAGAIRVIQSCLPSLKKSSAPSVVLISSVAAYTGLAYHAQVSAIKSAIEGLTRSLAAEFAPAIRFNCVAPSLTDTPLAGHLLNTPEKRDANAARHPLKKIGEAEDIASCICYLLSEQSKWITGQTLRVDGGISTLK